MNQTLLKFGVGAAVLALLSACGGNSTGSNPVTGGPLEEGIGSGDAGGGGDDVGVPAALASNLSDVSFDAETDTLVVTLSGLDTGTEASTYERIAELDVPGYRAYSSQDDPLDRFFLALVTESPDGSTAAAVVQDGGQFNRFFGGSYFERVGEYTQPTSGLVSYAGTYAGTQNLGERVNTLPLPAGVALADGTFPVQPTRVTGDIFINVDFADNLINGEIFNRELVSADPNVAPISQLNTTLIATDISDDGTFSGSTELVVDGNQNANGSFAGTFGGTDASSVAGAVLLTDPDPNADQDNEHGAFALARCGTSGDSSLCDLLE